MFWSDFFKLTNQKLKRIIDEALPDIPVSPYFLARLRGWASLLAAMAILAKSLPAASTMVVVVFILDGMDGASARKQNINFGVIDSALDRFAELMLCACYMKWSMTQAYILIALSIINCLKSSFFNKFDWPSFPVLQILLLLILFQTIF